MRKRYTPWQKQMVMELYPSCRTTDDKIELARRVGIDDLNKLYNLASRLGIGGAGDDPHTDLEDGPVLREDPERVRFSEDFDNYLRQEFGRLAISRIARHYGHSEIAAAYRARKLGLRKPAQYWQAEKVLLWLGWTLEELQRRRDEGIELYTLYNRQGRMAIELISTVSLARWLRTQTAPPASADSFFLLEIEESVADVAAGRTSFAPRWLSHGNICLNPYALSFGLFCTGNESWESGDDPKCGARLLKVSDLTRPGLQDEPLFDYSG